MLLDSSGRPVRRAIGFFVEYRVERNAPAPSVELVDALSGEEIDYIDPFEYDNLELGENE